MENGEQTPPKTPAGAPADNAAVNQTPNGDGAATEQVTLSKADYDALIKQRDTNGRKAGDATRQAEDAEQRFAQTDAMVNSLVQKDAVRDATKTPDFKANYPDVTEADILALNPMSDEEITESAKALQERFEKVKQNHMKKVQVGNSAPAISPQDRSSKLKELGKPSTQSRFQQALNVMRMPTK